MKTGEKRKSKKKEEGRLDLEEIVFDIGGHHIPLVLIIIIDKHNITR